MVMEKEELELQKGNEEIESPQSEEENQLSENEISKDDEIANCDSSVSPSSNSSNEEDEHALEDNRSKKEKKPWSKKKNIIFWSVGGTLSLAIGIGAGVVLGSVFNAGTVGDYSNVDTSKYAVDYDKLVNDFKAMPAGTDYSTKMSVCDMANTALSIFYRHDKWQTQGYGYTSFNVMGIKGDQQIRSTFAKENDKYFEESLSNSDIVQAAWRMYEDHSKGDDSMVMRYKGTVDKDVYDSHFDESSKTEYSREDYHKYAGRYLDGIPCIYIISDKCLAKEDQKKTSKIPTGVTKDSTGYTLEIELDPGIAVKNYVVQMQTTTDLAGPPYFYFVHLTFKLDSKLNLISMTNYESYYAKTAAGAGSNMTAKVTTYFDTSDSISIPDIKTQTTYDLTKDK